MAQKILLIGWDGADWRLAKPLMEKGEMPCLDKFVSGGVMGNLASLQPILSPIIWTSIATGKLADKHGIIGFTEVDKESGAVRPSTSISRKSKAIWNILSQNGYRTHAVDWFSSHPAEPVNGVCISDLFSKQISHPKSDDNPLPWGTVYPPEMSDIVSKLRVFPQDIDPQTMALFAPRFAEVDQNNDHRLETIARMLAECFTVHAAATWIMEHKPWDFMAVYYNSIDHFCHAFMKYHPPRMNTVSEREFEFYKDVINSAYRLHDLLLGRLLELAGEETTVILCSDHGYHCGGLRSSHLPRIPAAPAEDHRPIGILAMKGPGIRQDELIHGASVLDITPTILTLFSLAVGKDMDGRPLFDAFAQPPSAIEPVSSWDEIAGDSGMHPPGTQIDPSAGQALLNQFAALGYVEPQQEGDSAIAAVSNLENRWNLARVYLHSGRFKRALPLLEEIYDENPLRFDFGVLLAECQFRLGLTDEAYNIMSNLAATFPGQPRARMLLGLAEHRRGNHEIALEHLLAVEAAAFRTPDLYVNLGSIYMLLNRVDDAIHSFERALTLDSDTAAAHLGIARCLLRQRNYAKSVESSLRATGLEFSLAAAHFCLGRALIPLGQISRAIEAFQVCLRFQPGRAATHAILAYLYRFVPDGTKSSAHHIVLQRESIARLKESQERRKLIRAEAAQRANERRLLRDAQSMALMVAAKDPCLVPEQALPRKAGSSGKEYLIVSGLPRSGTSLMMQMLVAGGVPALTDGKRSSDKDNPEGYFEWELVKQLGRNPRLIEQAEGKALKVISLLLPRLPRIHRYKVIFMRRPVEEIAESQTVMLNRRNSSRKINDKSAMVELLRSHQEMVINRLIKTPFVDTLIVDYPQLIESPAETSKKISDFLGPDVVTMPAAMSSMVKPELYRQRMKSLATV